MAGGQLPHRNQGRATLEPTGTRILERVIAGGAVAVAFLCYYATLLPGLDLGDSASFQTVAGSLTLTPRQAYPLYYALGNVLVWIYPGEPARALNLASAGYAAIAVGLATLLASRLAESPLAGLTTGVFLAFSYTFWSQAITAEVYGLHLLIVGGLMLALLGWADRPTVGRLACAYAICALGFGNHLGMVLLLPAMTIFLLLHRRPGSSDPLRPRMLAVATAIAAAGALQYAWNFRGLWAGIEPPGTLAGALGQFWFDVTKADWRETLVMNLSESGLQNRPAMYWFDLRQQFGVPGVLLAAIGAAYLTLRWPRRAALPVVAYLANLAFAWTYNVGDAYIFFLPAHYALALCAGAGVAAIVWLLTRVSNQTVAVTAASLCLLYPAWRGYDTFPALDRSWDRRAQHLLDQMTAPPGGRACSERVFAIAANWQVQNALEYYARELRPGLTWATTDELPWLGQNPRATEAFVLEHTGEGRREVLATEDAVGNLRTLGAPIRVEPVDASPPLASRLGELPKGLPYALGILRTDRAFRLDSLDLESSVRILTGRAAPPEFKDFTLIIGRIGESPALIRAESRPYRARTTVGDLEFDVRMESWLPTDTIRRSGFGHVIVNRSHVLTLERGVSLVVLEQVGTPRLAEYRGGLLEAPQRFRLGYGDVIPPPCYR